MFKMLHLIKAMGCHLRIYFIKSNNSKLFNNSNYHNNSINMAELIIHFILRGRWWIKLSTLPLFHNMLLYKKWHQETIHRPFSLQELLNFTPLFSQIIHLEECNSRIIKTASIKIARINSNSFSTTIIPKDHNHQHKVSQQFKINSCQGNLSRPQTFPNSSIREASINNRTFSKLTRSYHKKKQLSLIQIFKEWTVYPTIVHIVEVVEYLLLLHLNKALLLSISSTRVWCQSKRNCNIFVRTLTYYLRIRAGVEGCRRRLMNKSRKSKISESNSPKTCLIRYFHQ